MEESRLGEEEQGSAEEFFDRRKIWFWLLQC
jgi:hypothetical protein